MIWATQKRRPKFLKGGFEATKNAFCSVAEEAQLKTTLAALKSPGGGAGCRPLAGLRTTAFIYIYIYIHIYIYIYVGDYFVRFTNLGFPPANHGFDF